MATKVPRSGLSGGKSGRTSSALLHSAKSDRRSAKPRELRVKHKEDAVSEYDESEQADSQGPVDENRENLAWKVLTAEQIKEFAEIETVEDVQTKMAETMNIVHSSIDLKEATLLDYYTAAIWWGREQSFTHEQQSALFTVIHTLLDNIKEKHMTIVENLKEFKKMMAGIGVESSEISGGLECFDVNQAKEVFDYVHNSMFQHYRLFEFLFSHTQAEEIIGTDLEVETAPFANVPWPPPLEEGVCEEIFMNHIATPPPTPTPEEATASDGEGAAAGGDATDGATGLDPQKEADLMAQLSSDEIKNIINSVFDEMLGGLQTDIAAKLREKENAIITKINKIHKVAEK